MQNSDQVDYRGIKGDKEEREDLRDGGVEDLLLLVIDFRHAKCAVSMKYCLLIPVFQ